MADVSKWVLRSGVAALTLAVCGAIVLADAGYQRSRSRDFISDGLTAIATEVELDVDRGKGGTYIDAVTVKFTATNGALVRTELTATRGDSQGAETGRQSPAPGTRYAPPLRVLHRLGPDNETMAVVDADDWVNDDETVWVARAMLLAGTLGCGVVLTLAARRQRFRWRFWQSGPPRRH